jgi:signal recognition particle subunit SRP54
MAFESLSEKLNAAFKKLRGKGRLHEADIKEAMREVRMALLEADVSYKVVKDFIATVSARAVGTDVLESLSPAQMVIKIVNEELTNLMGAKNAKLTISSKPPTIVMRRQDDERREAGGLDAQAERQAPPPRGVRHIPSGGDSAARNRREAA